jgi:multidrug efflux pump
VHFVNTPNIGTVFFGIEPSGERDMSAAEIAASLSGQFSSIKEGFAFALMPPPVLGLGNSSGVEMFVQDRAGLGFGDLNNNTQALGAALRQTPGFDPFSVLSSFQSNVPQLDADVNRAKTKEQGILLTDVYEALQVYMGSAYVNDFNLFGRTYSVYAQADSQFRDEVSDLSRIKVRNDRGQMVPITSVIDVSQGFGPDPVTRYNGYPAADLSAGINSAVLSSGEALDVVQQVAGTVLPQGMTVECVLGGETSTCVRSPQRRDHTNLSTECHRPQARFRRSIELATRRSPHQSSGQSQRCGRSKPP